MKKPLKHFFLLCAIALLAEAPLSTYAQLNGTDHRPTERLQGWRTNREKHSIDLNELMSGGPPKDGIPAIDQPKFVSASEASRWLKPQEPVISLVVGAEARAYPLQILMWHEIVNDQIANVPVTITFCPLCHSAIVFDRRVKGRLLSFGTSGMLRHSDLVMYDRETESLWQQFVGEAVVGDLTGTILEQLPAQIISFDQFSSAYPQGVVLSRETGYQRPYGRNPYAGYDEASQRPFLFRGRIDDRLPPKEKVVTITINREDKAYPYSLTRNLHVIHDDVGGKPVVIFHSAGAVSALDQADMSASRQAGSTGVFDPRINGQKLTFKFEDGKFIDEETGSTWDVAGRAVEGKLKGKRLVALPHGDYFAFAWLAFKPKTQIYRAK